MFIISIDGGLGNQMFEYAFFLAMQYRFPDSKCYLDISMLKKETHNGYELERVFGINAPVARLEDIAKYSEYCPKQVKGSKLINRINKFRRIICGVKRSYIVQEDSTAFYNEYFELNELYSYYLRGIWANANYFSSIRECVMREFAFPEIQGERNKLLEAKIIDSNSISIHFRKGDYVKFGFEVLDEKYYHEAIDYMDLKVVEPEYFIFSDDIASAKSVIGEKRNYTFIDGNTGMNSFIDMKLMSLCRHNIIANSTFSFWGAYLNKNSEKIIIYPSVPLTGCKYPYAESDWLGI